MEEKKYNRKLYNKRYYEKNKESLKIRRNKWFKEHPDYRKKYYQENKEKIANQQKEYQSKNREKITKQALKHRKELGLELAKQGQMYTYYSRGRREKKMCEKISKTYSISFDTARELLIDNNWNCRKLLSDHIKDGENK